MTAAVEARRQYTAVAIVLHWAIAFAIAFMIPLGFWMRDAATHTETVLAATAAFQLHKSVGLTVLVLSLIRLGWRLINPPPPMPAHTPAWEKFAALATHWLFYVLIIGLPLTGWLYVSTAWSVESDQSLPVTTHWFHLFRVPPLFGLPQAPEETRRALAFAAIRAHWALAWGTIGLVALHVAAALKHQIVDRDEVLAHMVPGVKTPNATPAPKSAGRNAVLGFGFAVIAVCVVALSYTLMNLTPTAAATASTPAPVTTAPAPTAPPTPQTTTLAAATTLVAPPAHGSASWRVNAAASSIRFTTSLNDEGTARAVNGHFDTWQAVIQFDPADLTHASAIVTINTASAKDGIQFDEISLPTPDFFDTAHFPTAEFRSTSMRRAGAGYEAVGTITIKGHTLPATLPFTVTIAGGHAVMDGHLTIHRADAHLGLTEPTTNEAISPDINVVVHVDATRG